MLVIIEGADKTGKTTLAKEIEKLGFEYKHFGPPGSDPATEYARFLIDLKRPTVCDRFFYGELVYGPLLRGKSLMTPLQISVIERLCRLRNALLIHANVNLEVVATRMDAMGDELISKQQNIEAYTQFFKVLKNSSLVKFNYADDEEHKMGTYVQMITKMLDFLAKKSKAAIGLATGIGTFDQPQCVIVGDELNPNVTWLGLPFDGGFSSEYLDDCLRKSRVHENKLYVVNSRTLTFDEVTHLRENPMVKFIALGNNASAILKSFNVIYTMIPHPQFWRRFNSTKQQEYIDMLNEAIK